MEAFRVTTLAILIYPQITQIFADKNLRLFAKSVDIPSGDDYHLSSYHAAKVEWSRSVAPVSLLALALILSAVFARARSEASE